MHSVKNSAKIKLFIGACLLFSACAHTIVPKTIEAKGASFSGNVRNSGIVQFEEDGGVIIDSHAHDRYNSLITSYGGFFSPALIQDDGVKAVAAGSFWIDDEHLSKAVLMNEWRKSGKAPYKKTILETIKSL